MRPRDVALANFNFFSVFNFPFLYGDPKSCLIQPHSVVLTESVLPFHDLPEEEAGTDLSIRIRPKTEAVSLAYLEKVFHHLFPLNPFNPTFMNETNLKYYESEVRWKQILIFSAIITIFISCAGLFGLSVLSAERRVKEIGIRKVLDVSVTNVTQILSRDFLMLVLGAPCRAGCAGGKSGHGQSGR